MLTNITSRMWGFCLASFFMLLCEQNVRAQSRPKYRTLDGTLNNLSSPDFGKSGIPLFRDLPSAYSDGKNSLAGASRPTPRLLSNKLSNEPEDTRNEREMAGMFYIWGQFIDHDMTLVAAGSEKAPISLPSDEKIFSSPIAFTRSAVHLGTGSNSPREQTNIQTSWIDGSQVYGWNPDIARWLRTFQNGKLKVSSGNMLPFNTLSGEYDSPIDPSAPKMDDDNGRTKKTFAAGDPRAAEHPGLTSLHTLFVREHNKICDRLKSQYSSMSDEDIYQKARKEVGAMLQAITYGQWISSLGVSLSSYSGYKATARPDVSNIFSTAAYRWHTMVENDIIFRDNECHGVGPVESPLKQVFFNIGVVRKHDIGVLLKGLTVHRSYETDLKVNNGLRNFLFGPGSGLDLVSINLQRGRDHGLPDYNTVRQFYTGASAKSFTDISGSSRTSVSSSSSASSSSSGNLISSEMQSLYGNNINNIDLWVGLYAEPRMAGKSIGKTVDAIIRDQFQRLRDGDFYYFQNDPDLSSADRSRIQSTKLGDVISRNSNANNLQDNVFFRKNCNSSGDDIANHACNVTPTFEGWTLMGKHGSNTYYKWQGSEKFTEREAYLQAKTLGGHLPIIVDAKQNDFIARNMGGGSAWIDLVFGGKNWTFSDGTKTDFISPLLGKSKLPKNPSFQSNFQINGDGSWTDIAGTSTAKGLIVEVPCEKPVKAKLESSEHLAMEASAQPNRSFIEWVNNTGFKNDYFTVEKANNTTGEFEELAVINNTSNDASPIHYTAYDNAPTEGDNTYRVKVTFQDGSSKVSEPKVLTFTGLSEVRIFPNPANASLSIDLTNYKNQAVEVYLYNYLGQMGKTTKIDNVSNPIIELDIANQPVGQYWVRIQSKGKRDAVKSVMIAH